MVRQRHTPTRSQKKYLAYLTAERQRQVGSFEEYSQYPAFILNCCGCFQELTTSHPDTARDFIMSHAGHQSFSMEINVRPNSLVFDRKLVLEQLKELGLYLADKYHDDSLVLRNARLTYQFILREGDVEGSLQRLMAVFTSKDNAQQELADPFVQFWLRSILIQDLTFLKRAADWRTRNLNKEANKEA